jgi:hypothetical protein
MKPSVGRIVIARVEPVWNNGADLCPAIITRVWGDEMINVKLLPDGPQDVVWRTSVPLCADEASARAHADERAVFWPGRV